MDQGSKAPCLRASPQWDEPTRGWRCSCRSDMPTPATRTIGRARQPVTPVSQPPIVVPMRDLETTYSIPPDKLEQVIHEQFRAHRATLRHDRRHVLERFEIVDMARKVVGVGSVGTRAFVVLLQGRDQTDPLFLQVKEATASVLEDHLSASRYKQHGERVVYGQRMLQAASDISARRAMPTRTSRTTRRSWARSIPAGCKPSKACETADWRGEPRIPPMGGNRVVSLPHQRPGSREIGEREVDADELDPGLNGQVQELSMPLSMPLGGARCPPVRRRPAHGSIRGGSSPAGTARPATPRPGRSAASGRCRKVQHRRPAAGRVLSLVHRQLGDPDLLHPAAGAQQRTGNGGVRREASASCDPSGSRSASSATASRLVVERSTWSRTRPTAG
jgi:hypothetical protein